ncbi:MAG: NAD(P)-binding protein [Exilispira sp.]
MKNDIYDFIVGGGGLAGLTAAVYLTKENKKVLLIEKNEKCGGLMNSFTRDGFHFEGGARALVNSGLLNPMIEDLKLDIKFLPNPISIGIEDKIIRIKGEESLKEYSQLLKILYPSSEKEVDILISEIKMVIQDLKILYGADNPLFSKEKKTLKDIPKTFSWLFKFFHTISRINKLNIPIEEYLRKKISNQSLLDIFYQHFFKVYLIFFCIKLFCSL